MVVKDHLTNLLNHMMNCKRSGKGTVKFSPFNKTVLDVLEIMKRESYVKTFKVEEQEIEIEIGKLNFCKSIKPRFNVRKEGIDRFIRRFLPSRKMGIIIMSTNKGLMTHAEANEEGLGGKLIAFCY